jgi:hypothetical protein
MMLTAPDLVVEHTPTGPRALAVFDLSDVQLAAVREALDAARRERYAHGELDVDDVRALAELRTLTDQVETLALAGGHATLRLAVEQVELLAQAVGAYLLRDTADYQPPELRERLALLGPLAGPLLDLVCELRSGQRALDELAAG